MERMFFKQTLSVFLFLLISLMGHAQSPHVLTRDTVNVISLYYWQDEAQKTVDVYSYVEYDGAIYNATRYLNSRNSGCIPIPLGHVDNDCAFKLIRKYIKTNPEVFKKKPGQKLFGFKSSKLDVLFTTASCELQKSEFNPLRDLMGDTSLTVIHFLNVISNKLTSEPLPRSIQIFLDVE